MRFIYVRRFILSIFIPAFCAINSYGQSNLTLEDAVKTGLKQNNNIQIARNLGRIAEQNASLGTAGFLPKIDAAGSYSLSQSNVETNSPFSFGNTDAENISGQLSLNWTLFDGLGMFSNKSRFNALSRLGTYQSQEIIENLVVAISAAYFNLVRQEMLLDVSRETMEISQTRLEKEQVRHDVGGASSTDLLNARVSFNNDEAIYLNQEMLAVIARKNLNVLLGQNPAREISVIKEIDIPLLNMTYDQLLDLAMEKNSGLRLTRQGKIVADKDIGLARAKFLPRVSLQAAYGYSDRTTARDVGEDITSHSTDGNIGLNLSYNLFNGGSDRVNLQTARLTAKNQTLNLREREIQLSGLVNEKYESFLRYLKLVELEEQNVRAAAQNLELQNDRYQLGSSSSLEFRDAQVSFSRAQIALISARYSARITFLEIQKLTGQIDIN
ncbi:MAG: TolC family protein [Candidatus Zixiibacteriota bacterium]